MEQKKYRIPPNMDGVDRIAGFSWVDFLFVAGVLALAVFIWSATGNGYVFSLPVLTAVMLYHPPGTDSANGLTFFYTFFHYLITPQTYELYSATKEEQA